MRNVFARVLFGIGTAAISANYAYSAEDILFNRYNVLVQHDKLDVVQKTAKELNTPEGQALASAVAAYFGIDPGTVNVAIAAGAKMIVPNGQQDMNGIIRGPGVGYTICYAVPANPNMKSGDKGIETHGDSTFNTTLIRVVPGASNDDGLGWSMTVPYKATGDARVNAVFDVVWVKADPGWQQKYSDKCHKRGEHPWLARNNHTQLNAACTLGNAVCE